MLAIILLGPPGAGKGTQAAGLARDLGIPHVSTGVILREAAAGDSELGRRAREVMAAGKLVDDPTMIGIMEERLSRSDCERGAVLDGFPRTGAQAEALGGALDRLGARSAVLNLAVPREELVARIRGRRLEEGRQDDSESAFEARLDVYEAQTRPLLDHYRDDLAEIDGVGAPEEIARRLRSALQETEVPA